jgi:hypothetical protein
MESLAAITGILVLAALSEAIVEYLFSPIIKAQDPAETQQPTGALDWRDLALRYTAAGVGVALSVTYQADLLEFFGLAAPWPWVGWLITGLLIGRGSNFVHDFAGRWLKPD